MIKTENGVKVITDHGEELLADVVLFATGNYRPILPNSNTELLYGVTISRAIS